MAATVRPRNASTDARRAPSPPCGKPVGDPRSTGSEAAGAGISRRAVRRALAPRRPTPPARQVVAPTPPVRHVAPPTRRLGSRWPRRGCRRGLGGLGARCGAGQRRRSLGRRRSRQAGGRRRRVPGSQQSQHPGAGAAAHRQAQSLLFVANRSAGARALGAIDVDGAMPALAQQTLQLHELGARNARILGGPGHLLVRAAAQPIRQQPDRKRIGIGMVVAPDRMVVRRHQPGRPRRARRKQERRGRRQPRPAERGRRPLQRRAVGESDPGCAPGGDAAALRGGPDGDEAAMPTFGRVPPAQWRRHLDFDAPGHPRAPAEALEIAGRGGQRIGDAVDDVRHRCARAVAHGLNEGSRHELREPERAGPRALEFGRLHHALLRATTVRRRSAACVRCSPG